jgi:hypothetical protein
MIITQYPTELHTAFNPCIIKVTKGDEEKAKIYVAFGIYTVLPATYVTVEREYFNNEAYFDIQRILRNGIGSGITAIAGSPCWIDKQFFVEYTVFDNLNALVYSATAINAVAQVQETSNLTDKRGHFMTKFDKLKRYAGYPLQIVAFSFRTGQTYIRFDGDAFAQVSANVFVLPITAAHYSVEIGNQNYDCFLRDNQGRVIEDNFVNGIQWTDVDSDYKQFILPIENPIMPENPFYVKWENRQGGFDYWMFSYRQYFTSSVTNIKTIKPVVTDQQTAKGFTEQLSVEGIEKVKVGAQGLTTNEYNCISKLIYSPQIEWFNEVTQSWQTLIIDKGENENDTHNILNELEFTFILPTPQLQF